MKRISGVARLFYSGGYGLLVVPVFVLFFWNDLKHEPVLLATALGIASAATCLIAGVLALRDQEKRAAVICGAALVIAVVFQPSFIKVSAVSMLIHGLCIAVAIGVITVLYVRGYGSAHR